MVRVRANPNPDPDPDTNPNPNPNPNPNQVALRLEELGEPLRMTAAIVQALLFNNAALACEADPNRPRPPTNLNQPRDLTPNPGRVNV